MVYIATGFHKYSFTILQYLNILISFKFDSLVMVAVWSAV